MATIPYLVVAQFIDTKVGSTGLTMTCDVDEYDVTGSAYATHLTGSSMTETRNGQYRLFFTGDDDKLYIATAKTADTDVDQQHIPAMIARLDLVNTTAQTGADGDTLETLSDEIATHDGKLDTVDGIVDAILVDTDTTIPALIAALNDITAAEVWANSTRTLTQSAAAVAAAVAGSTLTILRGDTLSASLTGLGSIAARSKLWFTVKANPADTDAEAIIQADTTTGLLYIEGAAYATAAHGTITVDDEDAGDITITLDEAATALLSIRSNMAYDVQMLTTAAAVQTMTSGVCNVTADATRAIA